MDDMVERVAKAMAENNDFCWDYCDKPTWRRDARLALELSGVAELRAALESLTKDPPPTLDEPDTDAEVVIKMRAIAREALG